MLTLGVSAGGRPRVVASREEDESVVHCMYSAIMAVKRAEPIF